MAPDTIDRREDGFEYDSVFYRWHVTDTGKDLMLIDRFTGMPIAEFFETIEDQFDRGRAPILLALMATSIRARFPDWSVERIARTVQTLSLGDVEFIEADAEEQPVPPAGAGNPPADTDEPSSESSRSLTLPGSEPISTSSETRASSSSRGSRTGSPVPAAPGT